MVMIIYSCITPAAFSMTCRENDAICVLKLVLLRLLFSINDSHYCHVKVLDFMTKTLDYKLLISLLRYGWGKFLYGGPHF